MKTNKNIKITYSFLKLFTASDLSRRSLPLMSIESVNPGPIVWLIGCVHGDEVGGLVVIQEIFKFLKKTLLSGAVYAFPLMNPIGFEHSSRYVTLSEEDLNRSFPGKEDGSLAERMAYQIFNVITKKKPILVLDLHNDWIKSIPFVLVDYEKDIRRSEACEKAKIFSRQSGLLSVMDPEEIAGTLSYNLIKKDIPALSLELGEAYIINEKNVEVGVNSILNILNYLKMVEFPTGSFSHPLKDRLGDRVLCYSCQVGSSSGVIRFFIRAGDIVRKGQTVAKIYNAFGKLEETITALNDGVVLGHAEYSVAYPGVSIISFGKF